MTERVEWHNAPDFAEVAEALRIPTDLVMAVRNPNGRDVLALFTVEHGSTLIYSTTLRRGVDGVLFEASPRRAHPGMWEQIVEKMDAELPGMIERRLREEGERG